MKIKFSPFRGNERLDVSVSGDSIIVNGTEFDFSQLQEGDVLPSSAIDSLWFGSDVERVDGVVCLTLRTPHGFHAPQETLFPENFDTYLTVVSGLVPIPAYEVDHD